MKKITLATVKKFIKENKDNLLIKVESKFDGMTDCVQSVKDNFDKAISTEWSLKTANTLGIQGAWFVGESRDYFTKYESDSLTGIEVYNSCGSFILAVKKLV